MVLNNGPEKLNGLLRRKKIIGNYTSPARIRTWVLWFHCLALYHLSHPAILSVKYFKLKLQKWIFCWLSCFLKLIKLSNVLIISSLLVDKMVGFIGKKRFLLPFRQGDREVKKVAVLNKPLMSLLNLMSIFLVGMWKRN